MEYLLMMLVVVGALVFVGYPLANPRRYGARTFVTMGDTAAGSARDAAAGSALSAQHEQLASAREQAFDALRDFEFDHATGKLSTSDYQSLRARYEGRAANVLQQLDALAAKSAGTGERVSRARRQKTDRTHAEPKGGDSASPVATTRPVVRERGTVARAAEDAKTATKVAATTPRVCPRCQRRAAQGDRFCMACGGALPEETK